MCTLHISLFILPSLGVSFVPISEPPGKSSHLGTFHSPVLQGPSEVLAGLVCLMPAFLCQQDCDVLRGILELHYTPGFCFWH